MTPDEMKKIRGEVGMHRPEFAKAIGSSPRAVKYYEDGEYPIPKKIANSCKWIRHCYRLGNITKGK